MKNLGTILFMFFLLTIPLVVFGLGIYLQNFAPDVVTTTHHAAQQAYDTYSHSSDNGGTLIFIGVAAEIGAFLLAAFVLVELDNRK